MGCCKPRNVVWIAEFSDLHYKGITFLTMTSTHIVYLSNNRGIECKYMKHIFELRMKDQIEERSSQLLRNLSSCEKKA